MKSYLRFIAALVTSFVYLNVFSQTTTETITATGTWTCPPGVTSITVECIGGGGAGGGATGNPAGGGGGSAGGYASSVLAVTPGTVYNVTVGAGGAGGTGAGGNGSFTWFGTAGTVYAVGGLGGAAATVNFTSAAGAAAVLVGNIGTVVFYGGGGGTGVAGASAGGGGGGAGTTGNGGNGGITTGGIGGSGGGADGGDGGLTTGTGGNGNAGRVARGGEGGGGGRAGSATDRNGGAGRPGVILISYSTPPNITPFADLSFCGSSYPTTYQTVSFSLKERLANDFGASQTNGTIILTLPTGFEFNTAAGPTVTRNVGDISAISFVVAASTITVTLTTDATPTVFDSISFNNFEIRATAAGYGDLTRTAGDPGTFLIVSTTHMPLCSESFGFMYSNTNTIYDKSAVTQYTTADINKNCQSCENAVILSCKITFYGGCPPPEITQFDFSTAGDAGYSQNPATNISAARIYFNHQLAGAPLITDQTVAFGSVNSPNGPFTITGSQFLDEGPGDYYFFLVYEIPPGANATEKVDASMISFVMDGTTISDMTTPNPTGTRTIIDVPCYTPDVVNPSSNIQTIPMNSYVIPMDNTYQALVAPFNLKAYGLVHSLLMNDIPVKWVIRSGKAKDDIDFTANASRVYPTVVAAADMNFIASAFIIDSTWINRSYYATGKTATQVINDFYALGAGYNQVAVYKLTNDAAVDVRYTLKQRPKLAIFSNGNYQTVQINNYLIPAGITNYFVQDAGNFTGLAECYTFCSEAHWDYGPGGVFPNPDINPVDNVLQFVNEGGNFLAQCAGIDLYENHQPDGGHFVTTKGINFANATVTNTYSNHDMAFSQFQGGVIQETGTIEIFWPGPTSSYLPDMYYVISAPLPTTTVVASAIHLSPNDSIGGNVYYMGGHDYIGATIQDYNARKLYLNATLVPAARPTAFTLDAGADRAICFGQSTTLGGSPTGGSGSCNYIWSPVTGLDNPNSANPVCSATATTTYTVIANDNGCPGGPASVTVTVNPLPTITTAATTASACYSTGAQNTTLTYSATTESPTEYSITWSAAALAAGFVNLGSTPLPASPINIPIAAGIATGTYTGTLYVTNVNTCQSTGNSFTVTINPLPTITTAATASAVCFSAGAQNSALTYSATTQSPTDYTITWDAAALAAGFVDVGSTPLPASPITVPVAAGVVDGTYNGTLIVTNGNGCSSLGNSFTITINPLPTITSAATATAVCYSTGAQNSTLTYSATTQSPTNYTITWDAAALAAGFVNVGSTALPASPITVPVAAGIVAGTYNGTLTVTNGNGCASTGNSFTITINPLPTITTAATAAAVCFSAVAQNSTLTYSATTESPTNYTITWNAAALAAGFDNVGSTALPASPITVPVDAGIVAGTYTGTLAVTNGNGCASIGNSFTITINPLPTITSAATAAAVCYSTGAQNSTLTYSATTQSPTDYTITWNAAALAAGFVNVGSTLLPASPITVPVAAGIVAGTYTGTLAVTNGNGCASTGNSFTITINPLPTITSAATAAAVCYSTGAQNSTLTYSATTQSPTNYTITWNAAALAAGFVNVGSTPLPASPITVPVAAGIVAGTYNGTLTVTNGNGCASTGNSFTITINPLPTITSDATAAAVCVSASAQNSTLAYSATTQSPTNYTITWNAAALAAGFVNVGSTPLPASPITVPVAAGIAAGTYTGTLAVTNGNGCTSTGNSFTITINPLPTITSAATAAAVCYSTSAQNSTLTYSATTQSPTNYTITWNAAALAAGFVNVGSTPLPASPITIPVAAGIVAGTYTGTLAVTNGNGCASTGNSFTITINPLPTITTAATAAGVCVSTSAQNSTLTYSATTQSPTNYSITWNAAALAAGFVNVGSTPLPASPITVPVAAGIVAGTYTGTLTVTNGNGCSSTGNSFTITINPLPTITSDATAAAVCVSAGAQNSTLAYSATTQSPTNYTITWNAAALAAGFVNVGSTPLPASPITIPVAAGIVAGTYTGTLAVTNGNGCASTGNSFTITINPLPTITSAATAAAVCYSTSAQNSTLTYSATTQSPNNYTITWNAAALAAGFVNVGSTPLPASPITIPVAAGIAAGTYTGTLNVTNGNGCASTGNTFTITISLLPTITSSASAASVCYSTSAQNSTLEYSATTQSPTTYSITWNAAALAAGFVNVGSTPLPVSPITIPVAAGIVAGTYTGTLYVSNGCNSIGNSFDITINPLPTITIAANAAGVCYSTSAQNSTLTYSATTGSPTNYTITWNAAALAAGFVNVGSTLLPASPISIPVAAGIAVGTYTGTINVTNANGCASTGNSFTITINPLPTITTAATAAAVCNSTSAQNSTLTYSATTESPTDYTITWDATALAAGFVNVGSTPLPASPITIPVAAGIIAGTYNGTLNVTNGNGCASTGNSFTITIYPLPTITTDATAAGACFSSSAQNSTLSYSATTESPTDYTITWDAAALAAGFVNVGSTPLPASPITIAIAAGTAVGTYNGTLNVTNANGCISTGNSFTISIGLLPTITSAASATPVCYSTSAQNSTLTYSATTQSPTTYSITWNAAALAAGFVNVGSTPLPASPITIPVAAGIVAGTYTGTLYVSNGCNSDGNSFTITIYPLPTITTSATAADVCFSSSAQNSSLTYSATTQSPTNYTITWDATALAAGFVNVGSTPLPASPITIPVAAGIVAGTYNGTLNVTNGNGCASSGNSFTITINPLPTITIDVTAAGVCYSASAQNSTLTYSSTTESPTNYTITWDAAALAAGFVNVGSTPLPASPITIAIAAGTAVGTYNGTLNVTNANGCVSTGNSFTISIGLLPTITSAASAAPVCYSTSAQNSTLTYSATTQSPTTYSITWNAAALAAGFVNVGSTPLPASPITIPVAAGIVAGTYTGTLYVSNGCNSDGNSFTISINPLPTITTAANATGVCYSTSAQNSTLTYSATTESPTNYTITWDAAALAAGFVNVGSTPLPVSPITVPVAASIAVGTYTGTINVTNANGCASTGTSFTITINPLPTITIAASAADVCYSTSAQNSTLTYSATTQSPTNYTITWDATALTAGFVNVGSTPLPASPVTVPVAANIVAGAYTGTLNVTNGNGCASSGNSFTITIIPIPAAPTASDTTICINTSATLTATAPGGTYEWYDAASGGTLLFTGASYTTPLLAASTTYYVQTTVSGCTGSRIPVLVTVSPVPAAPTASGATICQGTTATLTATAPGGTYGWYDAASGGTLLYTGASYTTPVLSSSTTYYVQTTVAGCPGPRTAVLVTVNPTPATPTASGTTICAGNSATLTATAPGGIYDWYNAATGGTLLYTGASYTTPVLSSTTTYYVQSTISGCTGPRRAVTVTVTPIPAAPTASDATICEGNAATLTATAPGGTYEWYDAASGGTLLYTGASYTTPVLSSSTTYYVQTTVSGCVGPRAAVDVTVNPTPAAPTASETTICEGFTATLTATAPSGTYEWYDAATGGTLLFTGATFSTPPLTATTNYYVQTTILSCPGPRTTVTVTVIPTPAAPTAPGTTICINTTATLTATAPGGTYEWYDAASGGTLLFTGASYTTPVLVATTTYYVQSIISGCVGPRTAVQVIVSPVPAAPTAADAGICIGATATLSATAPGGTYQWYDAAVGGTLLFTGASYTTPALFAETHFYVQTTIAGCTGPRTDVTVSTNVKPPAPTAPGTTICQNNTATLNASVSGDVYEWYNAATGGTLLYSGPDYTTPVLSATTTYYVQTNLFGCLSDRTAVTVTVTPTPATPTAPGTSICTGNTATVTATAPGGTYEWFDAASGGNLLTTGASYTTPVLTLTTTYYVQTTINGCVSARRAVTVTVNPYPVAPSASGTTICNGSTATITATAPGGTYQWYDAPTGGTLLYTGASYTTPPLSDTTSFYVQTTVLGCTGSRTEVTVNVNDIPVAPTASGTTICQGTSTVLTATAPGGTYAWYTAATGGTLLITNASYATPVLSSTTTYYVQTTVNGCTSTRTAVTVTVTPTPANPTVSDATICEGYTTTLTATAPGGTYEWYDAATGGTLINTGASYTTPVLTDTTTYYVQTTINGCTGNRTSVTVDVTPTDDPSFSYPSGTYCETGINPVPTITGGFPGSFSSSPAGLVFVSTTTGEVDLGASALNTYSVTYTTTGPCPDSYSVNLTITNAPDPTFSYNDPYCQTDGNPLPTFGPGTSAGVFSAVPAGMNFVNVSTGEIDLTTTTPGTYTVTNTIPAGFGCALASADYEIDINTAATVDAGTNITICDGEQAALNGSIGGSATSATWSAASGTFDDPNNPTTDYTPAVGVSSIWIYLTTEDPSGPCSDVIDSILVSVTSLPDAPTATGTTICEGETTTLVAVAPGGTYDWFDVATGGTSLFTGASFTTPALTSTTTYYVQTTVNNCAGPRTAVTVDVTPLPAAPTAADATICDGETASLSATAPGGSYEWYDAATGGTLLASNANYTTDVLSATISFYVQTTILGCTGPREEVVVTVNPIPAAPTTADIDICYGTTGTATATAPGGTYEWYDDATGGTLLFTGASYTTPVIYADVSYYVQTTILGCTGSRTEVYVTSVPLPDAPTASGTTICELETTTLTATAPGGTYEWFDVATGGTSLYTGASFTTPALIANTTYYVQSTIAGCPGPRTPVLITVTPLPNEPTAAGATICAGETTTLIATAPGGDYEWYDAATSGTLLYSGANFTTPALVTTTSYFVQTTISACTGPRTEVIVTVNPIPALPTVNNVSICDGSTATLTATAPGGTYQWYDAPIGGTLLYTGASYTTPPLSATTTYYVQTTVLGCTGSRKAVTVTVNPIPSAPTASGTTVCQGGQAILTATAPGGTYRWYTASTGGTLLYTGASYTTPPMATTTTYYVQTTVLGCVSSRTPVTVDVTPLPAAPTASGATICEGFTTTLTATAPGGDYEWFDAATGGNSLSTLADYTTPVMTLTDTFYVETTISACAGPRTEVIVIVTPTDDPTFAYASGTYCISGPDPIPTVSGGYPGSFSASPAGMVFTSTTTGEIDVSVSAINTYTVSYITSGPCPDTMDVLITITDAPVATFSYNSPFCQTGSNELPVFPVGSSAGVFSAVPAGLTFVSTVSGEIDMANTAPGTYTITNFIAAQGGCIEASATYDVDINTPATADAGPDQTVCEGFAVSLDGSIGGSALSSQWSGGLGTFSDFTDLHSDYYPDPSETTVVLTLTTDDPAGPCPGTDNTMTITINPTPDAPTSAGATVCEGGIALLIVTAPGGTYEWYDATTGGTLLGTGDTLTTPALTVTTSFFVQTTVNGCIGPRTEVVATVLASPTAEAGADLTACANNADVSLSGVIGGSASQGVWTSNGTGIFIPDEYDLNATYQPSNSDTTAGTVLLTLTSTDQPTECTSVSDTVRITYTDPPWVFAGNDKYVCIGDDANISGQVSSASGTGQWSTTGDGSFDDEFSLSAVYTPGANDISNESVSLILTSTNNGTCNPVTDTMIVLLVVPPTVDAGSDQTACTNTQAVLSGSVSGTSTTGVWSSTGTGIFLPNSTDLNATYYPSSDDGVTGWVTLTLTSTNSCEVQDDIFLTVLSAPTVDAGPDQIVCADATEITLAGNISGITTTGIWNSDGTGSYNPDNTTMNAVYYITQADSIAGTVLFVLTSTNNDVCNAVTDTMVLSITTVAYVNAGPDTTVCANNTAQLAGVVIDGAGADYWSSSGSGYFLPDSTALDAVYVFSNADTTAHTVTLTLNSTGGCALVTDNIVVTISPAPQVDAGADMSVCSNNPDAILNGNIFGGGSTGIWTTDGDGTFNPSANNLNATYSPGASDIVNGSVYLVLVSDTVSTCYPASDTLEIIIFPPPSVNAGNTIYICNDANANLNGTITGGAGTGIWSTAGDGTFTPNDSALNATYIPGTSDIAAGTVILTLTSTNNNGCIPIVDNVTVNITNYPTVNAGTDLTACTNTQAQLSGSVSGSSTTGVWATTGTGIFLPDSADLNAIYYPSIDDGLAGSVIITLSSTLACQVTDSLILDVLVAPDVDAGPNQVVCADATEITLAGSVSGITNTGFWSSSGTGTYNPDSAAFNATYYITQADSTAGTVQFVLTSTNNDVCNAVTDTMALSITTVPDVDAGLDTTLCANNTLQLNGVITGGVGTAYWSTSGSGTFSADSTQLNAIYTFSNADTTAHSVTLTLTSTGACVDVSDNIVVTISPAPLVNAGSDIAVCLNNPDATLSGQIFGSGTTGIWTTDGDGTFNPSASDLNATYIPGTLDLADSLIVLVLESDTVSTCYPATDTLIITINPAPVVNAGSNQYICNDGHAHLNGSVSGPTTTGIWTTSGDGSFAPTDSALNATYYPGPNDISLGSVTLTLTSTNNSGCIAVSDNKTVYITDYPTVDAGADQTACTNTQAVLSGSVSGSSTSGVWATTGTGIFLPDSADLNATYYPSIDDGLAGSVIITLSSTLACQVVDSLTLTVLVAPDVNAGPNQVVCADATEITLAGSVSGITTTGFWSSTGTGTYNPDSTTFGATYYITQADSTAGTVQFVLTSTNNDVCNAVTDTMVLSITTVPDADAGPDTTLCANNTLLLNGAITGGAGTAYWSTSGSGTFFADSTELDAIYTFSDADTTAHTVTLTLTSTGACVDVSDNIVVTISPAPQVNAGNDISVCQNNPNATLGGQVFGGATTGFWTTDGDGTFDPSPTDLNATYIPGTLDLADSLIVIVLESDTASTCYPATDTLLLTISPPPVVSAGGNQYICIDGHAHLNGDVTGGSTTGLWQTSGDGTFAPTDSTLNATYYPGPNDISAGSVILTLTSTNNGGCIAVSDNMTITITDYPTVSAGTDITICGNDSALLAGTVSGSSTTGYWTTSGTGTFSPDSSYLNGYYLPDSTDIANGSVELILTSSLSCPVSDSITVSIIPAPDANAGSNQVVCQGDMTVDLNGSVLNASSYYWTTNGTGVFTPDSISLSVTYNLSPQDTSNGTIILTLVAIGDPLCTYDYDSLTVITASNIQVDAGNDTSICASANIILNGNANAGTVYWSTLGTGTFSPDSSDMNAEYLFSPDDTTAGSVIIILNSQTSCGLYTDSMTLAFTPVPYVDAGTDFSVCNSNGSIQMNGVVSGGTITGQWTTDGTGTFTPDDSTLNATYVLSPTDTAATGLTFWLTSTNNGGCVAITDSVYMTFVPMPVIFAGDNITICAGGNATLNGQITGSISTGTWATTGDGTFSPSADSLNTSYIPGTNDLVNLTVTLILSSDSSLFCSSAADSLVVTIIEPGTAADLADADSLCFGDSLFITPIITGDTGNFAWSSSGTGTFFPDTSSVLPVYYPSQDDLDSGIVMIFMHYTYSCGSRDDTLLLSVNPIPEAWFTYSDNCNDMSIMFIDSTTVSAGSIATWEWDFGDGNSSNLQNPSHEYLAEGTTDVILVVNSAAGCSDTVTRPVQVFEPIMADFTASDTMPAPGDQVTFTNLSLNALTNYWTFGDNTGTSSDENPSYSYNVPGTYPVWLFISGESGCKDSSTVNITIGFSGYAIPSAFTPNSDGLNDVFFIRGGPFTEYELRVFNDWGQQVFLSTEQQVGWDGTFKGKDLQEGVYVLIFRGKMADGTELDITGDISLIR